MTYVVRRVQVLTEYRAGDTTNNERQRRRECCSSARRRGTDRAAPRPATGFPRRGLATGSEAARNWYPSDPCPVPSVVPSSAFLRFRPATFRDGTPPRDCLSKSPARVLCSALRAGDDAVDTMILYTSAGGGVPARIIESQNSRSFKRNARVVRASRASTGNSNDDVK